ncbi:uncharacterized protein LOC111029048 [Myzus persicae]|uniref:uncharacterized protein LOC111029048 n=1 Tax=Myzus persicae TaxID=13164 RepID=UPI000B93640D|nr:uncharacterized protein LOC111029048 [Myzus persicae]
MYSYYWSSLKVMVSGGKFDLMILEKAYRKAKHLKQAKNKAALDKCRNIEDLFKAKPQNNQINSSVVLMPIVSINTEENTKYNQQTLADVFFN